MLSKQIHRYNHKKRPDQMIWPFLYIEINRCYPFSASAPDVISKISVVIAA